MTPYESESIALLRQILAAVQGGGSGTSPIASVAIADDRDLDSQWGDEEVRVNPRDWSGPSMKGERMSSCPPAFLDMLAETLDFFAKKNEASNALTTGGKPKAQFDRKAAARARGWASRLRKGWKPAEFDSSDMGEGDDWNPDTVPSSFAFAGDDSEPPF